MTDRFAYFDNVMSKKPGGFVTIKALFGFSKNPDVAARAEQMLQARANKDNLLYGRLKKQQLAFMPSCYVNERTEDTEIVDRTPYMVFDFDHVQDTTVALEQLKSFPWIYGARISAGGDGIFAVAKIDPEDEFKDTYDQIVHEFYKWGIGVKVDKLADIVRLRIYSGGEFWTNPGCETFRTWSRIDLIAHEVFDGYYHHGEYMRFLAKARSESFTEADLILWTEKNIELFSESSVAQDYMKCIKYVEKTVEPPIPVVAKLPMNGQKVFDNKYADDDYDDIPEFPMDVFPEPLQRYVNDYCDSRHLSKAFVMAGVITSFATAIGSKFYLQWGNFKAISPVFSCIVGPSGANKTEAIKTGILPILLADMKRGLEYKRDMQTYLNAEKEDRGDKPYREHFLVTDSTMEGIIAKHRFTQNGFMWVGQEIDTILKAFGKYSIKEDSGEYSNLLHMWDGGQIKVFRSQDENDREVESSRVSIIGGTQFSRVDGVFKIDGSGMIDRWLFFLSSDGSYTFNTKRVSKDLELTYCAAVNKVINTPHHDLSIRVSESALRIHQEYVSKTEFALKKRGDISLEAARKRYIYHGRLSLILHVINIAFSDSEKFDDSVPERVVQDVVKLLDYFEESRSFINDRIMVQREKHSVVFEKNERAINQHLDKNQLREKVVYYRKVGHSLRIIEKMTGVLKSTVANWTKDA